MLALGEKLKLRLEPDPILHEVCTPVTVFDTNLQHLGGEMLAALPRFRAVGLAAPQVGYAIRLFVATMSFGPLAFVNPEITVLDWGSSVVFSEGCLSLPGLRRQVERPNHIRIQAQDLKGAKFEIQTTGFDSVILQHEDDHLSGLLMTDRDPVDEAHIKMSMPPGKYRFGGV